MLKPLRVGISHGDYNGVGYEIIFKSLNDPAITELFTPVVFGVPSLAFRTLELLGINDLNINIVKNSSEVRDGVINLIALNDEDIIPQPGIVSKKAGGLAAEALEMAVDALEKHDIDVLVTAPISKEAVQNENFHFPGHTEFLEEKTGDGDKALMILCNQDLRVALLTIHIPLSEVSSQISVENICNKVKQLSVTLKQDFGVVRPTIAVLSLNPHSGDGGVIGKEEEEIIKPAIKELQDEGVLAFGPFAADGFFGHGNYKKFDGILAMYHDQGLAPFKTIAQSGGVNFTAGLPIIRTSPDHGTAFEIAWKGIADETSMRDAIYMAIDIFRRRKNYEEASANPLKKHVNERMEHNENREKGNKQSPLQEEEEL